MDLQAVKELAASKEYSQKEVFPYIRRGFKAQWITEVWQNKYSIYLALIE